MRARRFAVPPMRGLASLEMIQLRQRIRKRSEYFAP